MHRISNGILNKLCCVRLGNVTMELNDATPMETFAVRSTFERSNVVRLLKSCTTFGMG